MRQRHHLVLSTLIVPIVFGLLLIWLLGFPVTPVAGYLLGCFCTTFLWCVGLDSATNSCHRSHRWQHSPRWPTVKSS